MQLLCQHCFNTSPIMGYYGYQVCQLLSRFPDSLGTAGVGWDKGAVPDELQPRGTQPTLSDAGEAGHLIIDDQSSSFNVTALVGKKAILECVIKNMNNHSVSIATLQQSLAAVFLLRFQNKCKTEIGQSIKTLELK